MKRNLHVCFFAVILATGSNHAAGNTLPVYIEDNHAGSFYWLAQHLDLDQPCTLIHFDAHSDASGIFDSDNIRAALRHVSSKEDRQELLARWRGQGAAQCFSWIEPLMPAPIAKVIWVPGDKLTADDIAQRTHKATALLDGHLEAAPRKSGSFRARYMAADFATLPSLLNDDEPLIVTIDLDYFAEMSGLEQRAAFSRIWRFVTERRNVRALTFAISTPYLKDDAEAHQLLRLALEAALLLPTARIEFEPFLSVANDHSNRAKEIEAAGGSVPAYDLTRAPENLRAKILGQKSRIFLAQDRARWERVLQQWQNEAPELHLEVKGASASTDGVWRVAAGEQGKLELVVEPWLIKPEAIEWFVLTPRYPRCNATGLRADQVGFVANAMPYPEWDEIPVVTPGAVLPFDAIDRFFDRNTHCGSLRVYARAHFADKIRETPVLELRRFQGDGFRAAISEQFGLPYVFGSGELTDQSGTGPETNLGADCANFIVYALRRQGLRIAWSDPKGLRKQIGVTESKLTPGSARFTSDELGRGLIVHLGTHVAAVMEDRPPMGLLDGNDLVAHQLKGVPETLTLGALLRDRKRENFDLLRVPAPERNQTIILGGDVMLGRTCAAKIERGIDPFAGIADLLTHSVFAAANLECTISKLGKPRAEKSYSFRAPLQSAALLRTAGFRAVSLANNHALDFGDDGVNDCAQILTTALVTPIGVRSARAAADAYSAKFFPLPDGKRLALLAITDVPTGSDNTSPIGSIALASDRARLSAAIVQAGSQANLVVCMVHWGVENIGSVTDKQRELARWLVDHGVDAVIGSHPHCLQPLDFYHGCPIAYSLGNLVFDGAPTVASWNHGALLEFDLSGAGRISSTRLIPIVLEDGLPRPAVAQENGALAKQ